MKTMFFPLDPCERGTHQLVTHRYFERQTELGILSSHFWCLYPRSPLAYCCKAGVLEGLEQSNDFYILTNLNFCLYPKNLLLLSLCPPTAFDGFLQIL